MATISTHTLDSVSGAHAGSIPVRLFRLGPDGSRTLVFDKATDAGGRLRETIDLSPEHVGRVHELVLDTGPYFAALDAARARPRIMTEIVARFVMPDPEGVYHIPMMLAPNSCAIWWSD